MSADLDLHHSSLRIVQTDPDRDRWPVEVQDHVGQCAHCRRSLEASLKLRAGLKKTLGAPAPAQLLEKVTRRLGDERQSTSPRAARSRPRVSRAWVPTALAAGLVLGVGLGPLLQRGDSSSVRQIVNGKVVQTVGDYLFDVTHDRYLLERTGHPIEKPSTDRVALSNWLSQGIGFDVLLGREPDSWHLSGGRVWHTVSRISALAEYDDDGDHRVTVFAVPAEGILVDSFDDHRLGKDMWGDEAWSYRGVAWLDGDIFWSAVSDLPQEDLLHWVESYRLH